MTTSLVLSIISLTLCIFGFLFLRRYIARKTDTNVLLANYRDEVYRLIAEIDAATDRDSRLVEERIKSLRKIIDDTDRRISVYMREMQRSHDGHAMYDSLGRGIRAALDSRQPALDQSSSAKTPSTKTPAAKTPSTKTPSAKTPAAKTPSSQKVPSSQKTQAATPAAPGQPESKAPAVRKRTRKKSQSSPAKLSKQNIKVQIAEMSAQGLSPAEIAYRLGLSLAEVDLALNILQRTMSSAQ